jgi:trk system potassium uptake protein TrkA
VAHSETTVESGDHVIVFIEDKNTVRKVERILQTNVAFL